MISIFCQGLQQGLRGAVGGRPPAGHRPPGGPAVAAAAAPLADARGAGRAVGAGADGGQAALRWGANGTGRRKKVTRMTKGFCQLVEIHFASWNYRNRWLVEMVFPGPMFCWCAAMKHSGLSKNAVDLKFNSWLSFSHSKSLIFPLTIAIKLGKKTTNSGQTKISYQVGYRTYYFPNIYI